MYPQKCRVSQNTAVTGLHHDAVGVAEGYEAVRVPADVGFDLVDGGKLHACEVSEGSQATAPSRGLGGLAHVAILTFPTHSDGLLRRVMPLAAS